MPECLGSAVAATVLGSMATGGHHVLSDDRPWGCARLLHCPVLWLQRGARGSWIQPHSPGSPSLGLCLWQLQAGLSQHWPWGFLVLAPIMADEAFGLAVEVLVAGWTGRWPVADGGKAEAEGTQAAARAGQHFILLQHGT